MKKICIAIISIALIIAFGISLNNVEKTELQSTDGRDFEKAKMCIRDRYKRTHRIDELSDVVW